MQPRARFLSRGWVKYPLPPDRRFLVIFLLSLFFQDFQPQDRGFLIILLRHQKSPIPQPRNLAKPTPQVRKKGVRIRAPFVVVFRKYGRRAFGWKRLYTLRLSGWMCCAKTYSQCYFPSPQKSLPTPKKRKGGFNLPIDIRGLI